MYIWFKWDNPDINPSRSFEFLNAYEFWGHILTRETDHPEVLPDGTLYQVIRNQGQFNTKLPLEKYPFDTQHLRMEFEDSHQDESGIQFVPDKRPDRDLAASRDPGLGRRRADADRGLEPVRLELRRSPPRRHDLLAGDHRPAADTGRRRPTR